MTQAIQHTSTSFLLLKDLAPLAHDPSRLAYASYQDVKPLIGDSPYTQTEDKLIESYDSSKTTAQLVFLGLDERVSGTTDFLTYTSYKGKPYFALDITSKSPIAQACEDLTSKMKDKGLTFLEGRMHLSLSAEEAAMTATARSMIDWNARNPFCAGCGQPTLSINAGFKRTCPPTDWKDVENKGTLGSTTASKPNERSSCATRKGISNLSFPRTDPTVIMACLSHDGKKILLGRQKSWPEYWYSCLAGFVEAGESVEEAVRREVDEEAGVQLGRVVIHSTQPWPYPNSLMIGCIAQARSDGEEIKLNDQELEKARWFPIEEVQEAMRVGVGRIDQSDTPHPEYKPGNLRLPPPTAIANRLVDAVLTGFAGNLSSPNL